MKGTLLTISTILTLTFSNLTYGQSNDVSFNTSYIKNNNQKTTIEINETQELAYIILALTDFAKENPNMVKQDTEYYKDVKNYFADFSNLPVVKSFDKLLRENVVNYFLLSGNAYGFKFKGNKLVPTNVYNFPAKGIGKYEIKVNPIVTYSKEVEEFVKKSNYRKFYKDHTKYYNQLKTEYQDFATIAEQKEWLESRFDYKINSFRVLTSPLIAGMNATHTFEDNGFREILLFLPTIRNNKEWSEKFKKAINTRIIFTEIDHNYVGPVSEKKSDKIDSIFNNREKWVNAENKSTAHYPNPIKVYDEYLTWGLFILYSYDKIGSDKELFQQIIDNVNEMMNKKGFPKAKEFNTELLNLYKNSSNKKIESLYDPLLKWSEEQ